MDPFIGQIIMFGGNFAPRGWAFCQGQLLPISQYSALFSLLGTTYGGDGRTTFALPDLRGRTPIGYTQGPALTDHGLGAKGGTETVTLTTLEMPSHTHQITGVGGGGKLSTEEGVRDTPQANDIPAVTTMTSGLATVKLKSFGPETSNSVDMGTASGGGGTIGNTGAGQAHNNMQPYIAVNYCIALQGIYPSRS